MVSVAPAAYLSLQSFGSTCGLCWGAQGWREVGRNSLHSGSLKKMPNMMALHPGNVKKMPKMMGLGNVFDVYVRLQT